MIEHDDGASIGHYDVLALARRLPHADGAIIANLNLTDRAAASSRVIRTLAPVPAHYHETCDEYVYILSGSGAVWLEHPRHQVPFRPGDLLFFARGVVHAMPLIFDEPVLCFSVDTPRRDPGDIVMLSETDLTFVAS